MRILRGDRIGLIGPNGAGKTTLLRLMLGTMAPDHGTVRIGTKVKPAYFDQMRAALDPDKTLIETISPGSNWIEIGGERKHVMTYLGDFLFPPQRAEAPIKTLSGGERNRLLLARLFAQPANLLVLDEPTNDLDIESLELLEATLQQYDGTLLLVSHDRAFLDNVVTQTLVAEGNGVWREYVGGYSDWLLQRARSAAVDPPTSRRTRRKPHPPARRASSFRTRSRRELATLPADIEALENEQRTISERMNQRRLSPRVRRTNQKRTGFESKRSNTRLPPSSSNGRRSKRARAPISYSHATMSAARVSGPPSESPTAACD